MTTSRNRDWPDQAACLDCGMFFAGGQSHDCPLPEVLEQVESPLADAGHEATAWRRYYGVWTRAVVNADGSSVYVQTAQKRHDSDVVDVETQLYEAYMPDNNPDEFYSVTTVAPQGASS